MSTSFDTSLPTSDPVLAEIRSRQNLPVAVLAGFAAALAGALIWASVAVATDRTWGIAALAVGLLVGWSVRVTGHGVDRIFAYVGAILSIFGVAAGNLFAIIGFAAPQLNMGYLEVLTSAPPASLWAAFQSMTSPMDALFYGLAAYEGWRFAQLQVQAPTVRPAVG